MTRTRWTILVVLAAIAVATLVWRPWDRDHGVLDDAVAEIERIAGVVAVEVEYGEPEAALVAAPEPTPSTAKVSVRLDETLTPDVAATTAHSAHATLVPAARTLAPDNVTVLLRMVSGEPEDTNGASHYPFVVPFTGASAMSDVADAYSIWQSGAYRVQVYGGLMPVGSEHDDATDAPAGMGIEAADADGLTSLAELANRLGRPADLRVGEANYYSAYGTVTDVEAVRLTVAASSRPGVESAIFSNSTAPRLSVHTVWPADSPETEELRQWLEAHDYATVVGRPAAYSISEPGYAAFVEGWVSGFAPPEPEPHALPLPDGADAWPDDPGAELCTGTDLEVSFGGSDAASGSRFALLIARNVSGDPCAIEGVPGVVFRTLDGAAQEGVQLERFRTGVVPARVVVQSGEHVQAPLQWRAMSTANDPDVTTSIEVTAVPGAEPVLLDVTAHEGSASGLDILTDAEVRLGPWVQALEGWS